MNWELINLLTDKKEYRFGLFVLMINLTAALCSGLFIDKFIDKTGGMPQLIFNPIFNCCIFGIALALILYSNKIVLWISGMSCIWLIFLFFKFIYYCNDILISMNNN